MMEKENNSGLSQSELDFLLEVEYLMRQIGNAHISLKKGYDDLIVMMKKNTKS